MILTLADEEATLALGRLLGRALKVSVHPPALLLDGPLGSGKTTLMRGVVSALPGAKEAEVSSPSFNIMNLYPTTPPVAHMDLYRLERGMCDDELLDLIADGRTLAAVEWPAHLDRRDWPEQALHLTWLPAETGRRIELAALGAEGGRVLAALRPDLETFIEAQGERPK